jgi:hypothetical protein
MWNSLACATLWILCAAIRGDAAGSPLRAGVASVEITPQPGIAIAGDAAARRADTVHDPLFARVLLLRTRDTSLALVTSDLHRLYAPALSDRIRRELGIGHVVLSASHSFSAPSIDERSHAEPWAAATQEKIFQAVRQAGENLFSADVSWGRGALIGGHNIRVSGDDGVVRERWSSSEEEGTAPIDPSVTVIRVDQEAGPPKAALVHYACEPAIAGPDHREVSAEYPGVLARYLQRELGADVVPLFVLGAAADIYPFRSGVAGPAAFGEIEKMGSRLGREAVRVARTLKPPNTESELQARDAVLSFGRRWGGSRHFQVGIQTVLLNGTLGLVAVPAHMFVDFQISLSARSPAAVALLLGNAYSSGSNWAGYIPTITAAAEGGFGASYGTEIEVGAGEALVNQGVIELNRFIGQLDDLPRGRLVVAIPDLPSP